MKCPNCDDYSYNMGSECPSCNFYEKPEYWDSGYKAIRIEFRNWGVFFNGYIVEQEFASKRDDENAAYSWEQEQDDYYREQHPYA